jgi:hypothetical protein
MNKTAILGLLMLCGTAAFCVAYESQNGYSVDAPESCVSSVIDVFNFGGENQVPGQMCNVNILTQPLHKDMDLHGYAELSKGQYQIQGATCDMSDEIISGMPAKRIVVSLGIFKFLHVCLEKDSKIYLLTYSASTDLFDKKLSEVEKMIKSWKF